MKLGLPVLVLVALAVSGFVFVVHYHLSRLEGTENTPQPQSNLKRIINKHHSWSDGKEEREKIREAFEHAYNHYEEYCLDFDELSPISKTCHNWLLKSGGIPLTMIDSLDTMLIMGLDDTYKRAIKYLSTPGNANFSKVNYPVSMFESSIRFLGGFLGAYTISQDPILLQKATEIGEILAAAFNTDSGIPWSQINYQTLAGSSGWGTCLVDAGGSVQLEFAYLSHLTKNPKYVRKSLQAWKVIKPQSRNNLYPIWVDTHSGNVGGNEISVGAMGDSFYEYVLKYWLLTSRTQDDIRDWYYEMADAIIDQLAVKYNDSAYFVGSKVGSSIQPKMQHLTCFAGGMIALSATYLPQSDVQRREQYMHVAKGIGQFCKLMYDVTPSKLSAESYDIYGKSLNMQTRYWIMRPEALETWFILYRITGDPIYRKWAWEFFETLQKVSRTEFGYSGLFDAGAPFNHDDVQQSFFLAETLKYMYLIFCPNDFVPLSDFIFNTEAHPFPLFPHWTADIFVNEKENKEKQ